MRFLVLASALLAVLVAGSHGTSVGAQLTQTAIEKAPRHAVSGLPVIPLTVIHGGRKHVFQVEVARSKQEQMRGLMFRTSMGPNEGMIFPQRTPNYASFWMKNTVLPLDIIYIGTDHRIMNVIANAEPYSNNSRYSEGLAIGVLELNGGRAAELGIGKGDLVKW